MFFLFFFFHKWILATLLTIMYFQKSEQTISKETHYKIAEFSRYTIDI